MVKYIIYMFLFISIVEQSYSQEDGVVALALPVRNSLKFNKYAINPTFSFVREQNSYITLTNKREWVQFNDAPQTYLFSYSGRFNENMGIGVGLFQQNYGVLTTFGGILNYAYNVVLDRDSNLTFGVNLGVYKSGINEGNVVTNFPDPSLQNIPSNTVITVNPGINYGTAFLDFGVSLNNVASYNFTTSELIEENPEQSIQGHIMYTGYVNSRGFFDETKFSGLVRSEFKKDKTFLSGIAMLTVPKGFWAQAGYNTLYGLSGGVGFNISSQIAIEYNYEKAMGDVSTFGSSHEITLAYKFKNRYKYNYSGDDDEGALIAPVKKTKSVVAKRKPATKPVKEPNVDTVAKAQTKADEAAKLKADQENQARLEAEAKLKAEETAKLKLAQEQAKAKADEAAKLKAEQENQARLAAEAKAKADEAARLKAEQENQARLAAEAKLKAEEAAKLKLAQEQAKTKADEAARLKAEQENQAKLAAEAKAKADEAAKAKLEQEALQNQVRQETNDTISQVDLDDVLVEATGRNNTKKTEGATLLTADSSIEQYELLIKLRETVASKEQDLKDLKEENDLSEQGIYKEPKPFKSVSAENAAIESLKSEIDEVIKSQNAKIRQMEESYNLRLKTVKDVNDPTNVSYLSRINALKAEQVQAVTTRGNLLSALEDIKEATEIERKRRIKRAAYDNEQDRYLKDRAALSAIKQNTPQSTVPLKEEDLDFGEEQSKNIQIFKGVNNVESGYYAVLAVHSDVAKRDEFLTKVVASGQTDINFFYDVNTSKYYIYYQKYDTIEEANDALKNKESKPYNSKMSMIKIEN
ncbi:PorP/SprF family type IX secretion system membrane protein [Confluentibacter sediminis]|uniref:PorP/SprF family type IX secretion system membrane protein n=1 Tax=Confluentibacter sediminis TaxID=2219045 RepID=UPI000DAC3DF4|nr:PorP/SprF family type IX secretion system membrane protein [Confluentibacter sediminis]